MAFLSSGSVELVPLDPDNDAHVEAYRRSRTEPSMRATGAYGHTLTHGSASEKIDGIQTGDDENALCAVRVDETTVGWAGVHITDPRSRTAGVGYYVLPDHQDNGYASAAARLLVDYAFDELNARRVEATVQGDNPASGRVLEKCGFPREGTKREAFYKGGEYKDLTLWAVLEDEFTRA